MRYQTEMEKRKYKKRTIWGERAEILLLELWAERVGDLRSVKKNGRILEEMASALRNNAVNVTAEEIKSKLQNMSAKYRNEKASTGVSGRSPSDWEHYAAVHQILGRFKVNNGGKLVEDSCEELSRSQTTECDSPSMPSSPRPTFSVAGSLSPVVLLPEPTDSFMEELMFEENDILVKKRQEDESIKQKDLLLNHHGPLNRKQTSRLEEKTNTPENSQRTKASTRFKSQIEADDGAENNSRTLSKLSDSVNDALSFIIKTESGKSRNDPFYKLMDLYLLQLPERTQDALKIKMLNLVYNKIND